MNFIRFITKQLSIICYFIAILIYPNSGFCNEQNNQSLPGSIVPIQKWTEQELWVWKQISEGNVADLASFHKGAINTNELRTWKNSQKLSSKFLETILLVEPYRSLVTFKGIKITGAWFDEPISFENSNITHELRLENSRFDEKVNLSQLRITQSLSLDKSTFRKDINLEMLKTDSNISMRYCNFNSINLRKANISGNIVMNNSTFLGKLDMSGLSIMGSLFMQKMKGKGKNANINLDGTNISGQLAMMGSKFTNNLDMTLIKVGDGLFLRDKTECHDITLNRAKIGTELSLSGTKILGKLNMNDAEIDGNLFMNEGGQYNEVDLSSSKISGILSMKKSKVRGMLNLADIQISGHLFMDEGADFNKINLNGAEISKEVVMNHSRFNDFVYMNGIKINKGLIIREHAAIFGKVDLKSSKIMPVIDIDNSKFSDQIDMNGMEINGSLYMRNGSEFEDIIMISAKITDQIDMTKSTFNGKLDMSAIQVSGHCLMGFGSNFKNTVYLDMSNLGNLDLINSSFDSLVLENAKVNGTLRLGENGNSAKWNPGSELDLNNTQIGNLLDQPESWPDKLVLDGFTYKSLGHSDMVNRDISWFKSWLLKQEKYSIQPSKQIAEVFRNAGYYGKANEILTLGRELDRGQSKGFRWLGLSLLYRVIGYGYGSGYFNSLYFIFIFIITGCSILWVNNDLKKNELGSGFIYSLDMLLPIVKLDERHYGDKIQLSKYTRYYFYFQKLLAIS